MKLALLAFLSLPLFAQEPSKHQLAWSFAALTASTTVDALESWHRPELNPVLASHGQFGGKAVSIKIGVLGALAIAEWKSRHHRQAERTAEIANYAGAAVMTAVDWRDR